MMTNTQVVDMLTQVQETMKRNRNRLTSSDLSVVMNGIGPQSKEDCFIP